MMINCKKCKTQNESTARFCFQCGTKVSSGFASLNAPRPQRQNKTRFVTALDPETFITHPHQKQEEVITRSNQGSMIAPELKVKLGLKLRPDNSRDQAKPLPEKNLPTEAKIPQPLNLKVPIIENPAPQTVKMKAPQNILKAKPNHLKRQRVQGPTRPVTPPPQGQKEGKRTPLLTATDKLTLQKQMPSRSIPGVKPSKEAFPMMNINRLEEQKAKLKKMHARRQQIQEDLAYLDELLPREEELQKSRSITQKPKGEAKNQAPTGNETISSPETIKPKIESPAPISTVDFESPLELKPSSMLPTSKTKLETNTWLQTIRHKRQSSPSEQLQNYQHGDSSEFITPFLTVAALVYFCYVLYI
jgi:hypothetical protein